ncbi:hypothetical protein COU19_02215 [Candidatus Kaiserbacteria bacterium CG10_big_fil_rev_8_21_14_0_10_56_12]|uniref:Bacterial spore germination immunoglobulin-like domain-containing protein n=1 Tax=Candidatus Kaiserbacteria bacterium CG10_big_fil_rev_8_21_14_0_10_56_12 TaxID=1974611 RepID=A0A2H0UBD0_9BACT|nr:MAG: hypothetical protein COU19_02215 [Candidatus Kaiserbacteria bacterium CG10_big_fil_rev_8_21_14_0_10_56_12]
MTRYLTALILGALILYGLVEAWPLLRGPALTIDSPADNATIDGGILTVSGTVARAAIFTINGSPVLYDQNGHFSSTLTFPRGGSILTFVESDRFGRTVTATRSIFVP